MVLKIDMVPYVIVAHYPAKFHQNPMKDFVENALKPPFGEGFGPQLLPKALIGSKMLKIIFHSKSSTC